MTYDSLSSLTIRFILASKIRTARNKLHLSLNDLAQQSGLSVSYLNEMEKGKKYPRPEKLMALAHALQMTYPDLVSHQVDSQFEPVIEFLESDFFSKVPLEKFGIGQSDLFDLLSFAPDKFSAFLLTMRELIRMYDISADDMNACALRAYQESSLSYFPELEASANEFRENFDLGKRIGITSDELESILVKNFNVSIDDKKLEEIEELKNTRFIYKPGKPHQLLLNAKLGPEQRSFIVGSMIGRIFLPENVAHSSNTLFNKFHSQYFAGAILIPPDQFVEDIKSFFSSKKFEESSLLNLLAKYKVHPDVLLSRLFQLLPGMFQSKQLFFLKSGYDRSKDAHFVSKEMHLSRLHSPHENKRGENYCRRWITIYLPRFFKDESKYKVGAQISTMPNSQDRYLCLSIARKSNFQKDYVACITLGILIDANTKKLIKFLDDVDIPSKMVGQTCERCSITDCQERVSPPSIHLQKMKELERAEATKKIIESL